MNVGKVTKIESVKGYKLNRKAVGCKYYKECFTCPYRDCIKDKKYKTPPEYPQAGFEQEFAKSCETITGKGGKG